MLQCKKCGADLSGGKVIEGISKKNNKPYKMVKCSCGGAEFLPYGRAEERPQVNYNQAPAQPNGLSPNGLSPAVIEIKKLGQNLTDIQARLMAIDKKQADLIALVTAIKVAQGSGIVQVKDLPDVWQNAVEPVKEVSGWEE
jgi:hypothetical protein